MMNTDNLISYERSTTAQFFFTSIYYTMLISLDMDVNIFIKKCKINSKSNRNGNIEKVTYLTMKQNYLYCTFHSVLNGKRSYRYCMVFPACLEIGA